MIVILGIPAWRLAPSPSPAGRACGIALAAAARGARVELVGRIGEDAAGEALVVALSRAGIGHAALLRDPARPTPVLAPAAARDDDESPFAEPLAPAAPVAAGAPRLEGADIDLAIRYLEPSGVLVATDEVPADALGSALRAAVYAGLRPVVLVAPSDLARTLPPGLPEDATVLAAPDADGDAGAFEALVGAYAASLDAGASPAEAFEAAQGATGWEPAVAD